MDPIQLAREVLELAAKATAWTDEDADYDDGSIEGVLHMVRNGNVNTVSRTGEQYSHADLRFIAHARTSAPALAQAVIDLQTESERLREALRPFATLAEWLTPEKVAAAMDCSLEDASLTDSEVLTDDNLDKCGVPGGVTITLGHCRAAAALLKGQR